METSMFHPYGSNYWTENTVSLSGKPLHYSPLPLAHQMFYGNNRSRYCSETLLRPATSTHKTQSIPRRQPLFRASHKLPLDIRLLLSRIQLQITW